MPRLRTGFPPNRNLPRLQSSLAFSFSIKARGKQQACDCFLLSFLQRQLKTRIAHLKRCTSKRVSRTHHLLWEATLLRHYREIFYGLAFGAGAALLDTFMDAKMEGKPFWTVSAAMLLYRLLFLLFGFILGWLLWRKNQREREFRHLLAAFEKLRQEIGAPCVVIHAQTQLLLARPNSSLPPDIEVLVRSIYEQSQKLQSLTKDSLQTQLDFKGDEPETASA